MAEERSIIFKLQLDSKALINSGKEAEAQLEKLRAKQKEVGEQAGKDSLEYRQLESQIQKYNKQLKDSANALAINDELAGKSNLTRVEQLRAQKALAVAYNLLTDEERQNTEAGRELTKQYKEVNEALQAQGKVVSDGRLSVGLYEDAIVKAKASLAALHKEQTVIGYAIGQNTKKLDDSTQALTELKAKGLDPTSKEYQEITADIDFYTEALVQNKKTLSQVEDEINSQVEALKEQEKEAAKIGFVYGNNENAAKSLKKQLAELKAELQTLDPNSEAFIEGTQRAAQLADKIKDVNEAIGAKASGSVFEQLSNQAGLLGSDLANLDFEGVAEKAKGFQAIASQISLKEVANGAKNAGSALVSLGKTLLTSPIFLIAAAGAAIFVFWDDLKEAIIDVDQEQQAYTDTLGDFKKGIAEASQQVKQVGVSFDLAKKGVISKEEALKTYNDTLGDSLGKATNLNEAEELFNSKTGAYVKAAGLRAQANALFTKAAEEQANAITAGLETQTNSFDVFEAGYQRLVNGDKAATESLIKAQQRGTAEVTKQNKLKEKAFTDLAEKLLKQAAELEKDSGIKSKAEQDLAEEQERLANERAQRAKERAAERVRVEKEAIDKIKKLILEEAKLNGELAQRELDARVNFRRRITELEITNAQELAEKLLSIEEDRIKEQEALNVQEKKNRADELKAGAEEELKAVQGTEAQKAEQRRLIQSKLEAELLELDIEFNEKELQLTTDLENAKQAVKDAQLDNDEKRRADRITQLEAELIQEENKLREAGAKEEEIKRATAEKRIAILKEQNEQIQKDEAKSDAEKLKAQAEYEAQLLAVKQEGNDKDLKSTEELEAKKKELRKEALDVSLQLVSEFYAINQQKINEQLNAVNAASLAEQAALAEKLDAGVISQEKYTAELKKIEIKKAQEEAKLKKEQFEKQKEADLIQAGASVAKAVISGYTSQPFLPVGLAAGSLALALGGVQIAKIASQKTPAFATGGRVLSGQLIGSGDGMAIRRANGDNLLATVKTNEVILNEDQQRRAGGPDFFKAIGVPGFAGGGSTASRITNAVNNQQANNSALLEAIANAPNPVVDVKDVVRELGRRADVVQGGDVF